MAVSSTRRHKGELHFPLPVGFVFEGDKIVLDPDQEVQGAVRMVFELFERESTAYAVVQRFNELGLRFRVAPMAVHGMASLLWGRLTHSRVLGILANPSYAGTYVFGRYQASKEIGTVRRNPHALALDAAGCLAHYDSRSP